MAVIYADVVTRIDERSADTAARQIRDQFDSATASLREQGSAGGAEFMDGLNSSILDGMGPIGASIGRATSLMRDFGAAGASSGLAAAAGIAAVGTAAIAVGGALYDVGQRFDDLSDSIAWQTGRMGESLDALDRSIRNVARGTASSIEDVAGVGARLSQAFDLSGSPLESLTKQVADLNRMSGQSLDVRDFGMVLRGFGDDGRGAGDALDALAAASQRSGIPLNELVGSLQTAGPAARSLGMDLDDTAGLILAFERSGIDADRTVAGLNRAVMQFAANSVDLKTGLGDTITQIRGFIDAGNDAAAVDLAGQVFGTRSAQLFVDAIRQGTLNLETFTAGLGETDDAIAKLDEGTANWQESWAKLKNTSSDLAGSLGGPVFEAVDNLATRALDFANNMLKGLTAPGELPGGGGGGSWGPDDGRVIFPEGSVLTSPPEVAGRQRRGLDDGRIPQNIADALAGPGTASGGMPSAPVLPYAPGYGQPPMPGETQEQWQARMADLAADHQLAEARARLNQLEQQGNADANATIAARNAVIDAEMRAYQTEQRLLQSRAQQLQVVDVPYPGAYGAGPRPGQTSQQFAAEGAVYEAQQRAAQAAAEFEQMASSGTATAQQLAEANNALVEARRNEQEALLRLSDAYAQNGDSARSATAQLAELGNQIDADFGASQGLAGIAENITRFVTNLAMAPAVGALQGIQLGAGGYTAGLGSGLAGLLGLSAGMGPSAAPQTVAGVPSSAMPYIAPYNPGYMVAPSMALNYPAGAVSGQSGAYPGDAALLANVPAGRYTQEERGDLTQGLADCTSSIEDLVNLMDGRPTAGASLSTSNADQWLQSRGFLPGTMPGAFNVGFWDGPGNSGHMQATLPGGTPFNWGSDASAAAGGVGGTGAFDPSFTSHYYRPVSNSTDGGEMPGGYAELSPEQLTSTGLMTPIPLGSGAAGMAAGPMASRFGRPTGPLPGPAAPSQSVIGGRAWGQGTPASGGIGFGGSGLLGAAGQAASAAGMAASLGAGGMDGGAGGAVASVAAQIGIQELQRFAGMLGQQAGNVVGGVMETFSLNDSALGDPSRSWLGRLATAASGVRVALPNTAGKEGGAANPNMAEAGKQPPGPLTPQQAEATKAADGQNSANVSNTVNNHVSVTNQRATEDYTGQVVQAHLGAQAMASAPR